MDILIGAIAIAFGLGIIYSMSPQWLKWGAARQLARAEGLEAQRAQRDRALTKWNAELNVNQGERAKPIRDEQLYDQGGFPE